MKKIFSLLICLLCAVCIFMYPSCKKIYHSTLPTPSNFRLLGYTKITTRNVIVPFAIKPVVTETYSFAYDGNNRLSQVLYSSNDSSLKGLGLLNLRMTYSYVGNTIYRTVNNLSSVNVAELDTFQLNGNNQLVSSNFPFETHSYLYNGVLLNGKTDVYRDTGTTISATTYYTSDNHDLLTQYFNGKLTASFPDSGIRPDISPADTTRDTVLSLPLNVTWTSAVPTAITVDSTYTYHTADGYSDVLSGYSQYTEEVSATDGNGISVRPVYFPAGLNSTKFFQIYDYLFNRIGDYLQLESFKTYGVNIYQNEHLVKQISTANDTTFVNYDIDAQSKVTETHVVLKDKLGNYTTIEYKLLYDTN